MESLLYTKIRRAAVATCGLSVLLFATGCGDDDDTYENAERPPAPIVVTAYISEESVSVSPASFGAGPVNLVITNQTAKAQRVTFESDGSGPGFRQVTGPINPGAPATLKADVPTGAAVVGVDGSGIAPARIRVGAARPSAQNDLLQP